MAWSPEVTLHWGGEDRKFALRLAEIRRLQEISKVGPFELLQRITTGKWLVDDTRETIRLGLLGGGANPKEAYELLKYWCDERPLVESVEIAAQILAAALTGPDEPVGKHPAPVTPEGTDGSALPTSTE